MRELTAFIGDYVTLKTCAGPIFRVSAFDIRKCRVRLTWFFEESAERYAWVPVTAIACAIRESVFQRYHSPGYSIVPPNRRKWRIS